MLDVLMGNWGSVRGRRIGVWVDLADAVLDLYHRPGRSAAARALFRAALDGGVVDGLRAAKGDWAHAGFKRQIAKALGRRVAPLSRGRPPRKADEGQLNLL